MFKLGNVNFEINTKTRQTAFFIYEEDGLLEFSVDILCLDNEYEGEQCGPYLVINPIETNEMKIDKLIGKEYSIDSVEKSLEREDSFYVYEHEPMEKYTLRILEIDDRNVHINVIGIAITDGYSNPYKTDEFKIDCWLPLITCKEDWQYFGL